MTPPEATPPQSGPTQVQVKAVQCPGCGASLTLRAFGSAATVVCESCHSILDATDPNLKILQQFKALVDKVHLQIPLGTRGTLRGARYEAVGFQRRTFEVEGTSYSWHEYVLFNPYKGFRYLTEYEGHWNDVSSMRSLPHEENVGRPSVVFLGERYKHFQTVSASTSFVLGEFPWIVKVGEEAKVTDYISPPRVISSEDYGGEVTWSLGEYIPGSAIWKAFGLPGQAPPAVGVYENQPSPTNGRVKAIWASFLFLFIAFLVLAGMFAVMSRDKAVFSGSYDFDTNAKGTEPSFVTDTFDIDGRTANIEVKTHADLSDNWLYVNYALINVDTGDAFDFGREVSYYSGYDADDGSWTEDKKNDTVIIPDVAPGKYYLRVEPESDAGKGTIHYSIDVHRDVFEPSLFGVAFLLLLVPAILMTWRGMSFEHRRWAESDYAG